MANEIRTEPFVAGRTFYMLVWSGQTVWNGSAFVAPAALARSTLSVAMSELTWTATGELSRYYGSIPAGCKGRGTLTIEVYIQAGGSPDDSDVRYGIEDFNYIDGKTEPEAMSFIAATTAGVISGAGTATETFKGLDGTTTRAVVTADDQGNRSAVSYT